MAWPESRPLAGGRVAWYGRWKDPTTGERREEPLGCVPEAAARAWAKQATVDLEGRRGKPAPVTADALLWRYLARKRLDGARPATVAFCKGRLEPTFAALATMAPFHAWRPDHLRAFLRSHPAWEPRTVQMHLVEARAVVRFAVEERIPCPDFAAGVKGPRVRIKDAPHYTAKQVRLILAAARGTSVELAAAIGMLAGLDYADLRALDVAQVHLTKTGGMIRSARSKTGEPIRVPIVPALREVLKRRMPKKGRVCAAMPADRDNASRALRRVEKEAGVPSGGWKRLRHTYGTLLAEAGADFPTIRFLMAHVPGSPMPLRYVHTTEERAAAVSRRMGRAVRRAGGVAASRRRSP